MRQVIEPYALLAKILRTPMLVEPVRRGVTLDIHAGDYVAIAGRKAPARLPCTQLLGC
jgi:hypothetical protein